MRSLHISEVKAGDELPPLIKHPTTRQLVQYAGASGDFYEIHYDRPFAEAAGLPGVILHGLLKAGWLGELVQTWAGPNAFVRHIPRGSTSTAQRTMPRWAFRKAGSSGAKRASRRCSAARESLSISIWRRSKPATLATAGGTGA